MTFDENVYVLATIAEVATTTGHWMCLIRGFLDLH